jgi:hypothetical protein
VEERAALDASRRAEDEDTLVPMAAALVDDARRDGVRVRPGRAALMRRALQAALRVLAPGVDVRASSVALDEVLALVAGRRRGQIHLAGGVVAAVDDEGVWLAPRQLAGGATPAYAAWDVGGDAREGTEDS